MSTRSRGRCSIATDTAAAVSAPAPIGRVQDAEARRARPSGRLAAMTGRTTLKFMPNVETNADDRDRQQHDRRVPDVSQAFAQVRPGPR